MNRKNWILRGALCVFISAIFGNLSQSSDALQRQWVSYFGGGNSEEPGFSTVCFDGYGYIYIAGSTESSGLAQGAMGGQTFKGEIDVIVAKFTPTGQLVWSRYLGGSKVDMVGGIAYDRNKKSVAVVGYTLSETGFGKNGADTTLGAGGVDEGGDGFVAQIDAATGGVNWSTYLGGEGADLAYDVAVDDAGLIYVVGSSESTKGISSNGTHQAELASSASDGIIASYSKGGNKKWGTYYGGALGDELRAVDISTDGDVIVGGNTDSGDGISSRNAANPTFQGGDDFGGDAMVASFDAVTGKRNWGSYFGGSMGEVLYDVSAKHPGSIIIAGATKSEDKIATFGSYQNVKGDCTSCQEGFAAAFKANGDFSWGTYVGASQGDDQEEAVRSIATDDSDYVYLAGGTSSTDFVPPNKWAFRDYLLGEQDGFIVRLRVSNSTHTGSTYFGGAQSDGFHSIDLRESISGKHYLALVGWTNSGSLLSTSGVHQVNFGGGSQDMFIARLLDPSRSQIWFRDR